MLLCEKIVLLALCIFTTQFVCNARTPPNHPTLRIRISNPSRPIYKEDTLQNTRIVSSIQFFKNKGGIRLVYDAGNKDLYGVDVSFNGTTKMADVHFSKQSDRMSTGYRSSNSGRADAILGIFEAGSALFLGLVTKSSPCVDLPGVQRVDKVQFLAIDDGAAVSRSDRRDLDLLHAAVHQHDFYFSRYPMSLDITRTVQGNDQLTSLHPHRNKSGVGMLPSSFRNCDTRFFWNKVTVQPFVEGATYQDNLKKEEARNEILNMWITPVVSAAITSTALEINNKSYSLTLISRRGRSRQGPRLRVRGIDQRGNVANFVETEQILTSTSTRGNTDSKEPRGLASFVQVRGSIPLFWEQVEMFAPKPRLSLLHNFSHAADHSEALRVHLRSLYHRYVLRYEAEAMAGESIASSSSVEERVDDPTCDPVPSLVLLNLVDKAGSQGELGRFLLDVLDTVAQKLSDPRGGPTDAAYSNRSHVSVDHYLMTLSPAVKTHAAASRRKMVKLRHIWYDFHHQHQRNPSNSNEIVSPMRNVLKPVLDLLMSNSSFCMRKPGTALLQQRSVIRTNCVDSLDRTNVAQAEIAHFVLLRQLELLDSSLALAHHSPRPACSTGSSGTTEEGGQADIKVISDSDLTCSSNDSLGRDRLTPRVEKQFLGLWRSNGDKISMLYAGTRALKQEVAKRGRPTVKGVILDSINSAKRYYLNIFEDSSRLRGAQLITAEKHDWPDWTSDDEPVAACGSESNHLPSSSSSSGGGGLSDESPGQLPLSPPTDLTHSMLEESAILNATRSNVKAVRGGSTSSRNINGSLASPTRPLALISSRHFSSTRKMTMGTINSSNTTASNSSNSNSSNSNSSTSEVVSQFETLLTARTSKVIAALDKAMRDSRDALHASEEQRWQWRSRHLVHPVSISLGRSRRGAEREASGRPQSSAQQRRQAKIPLTRPATASSSTTTGPRDSSTWRVSSSVVVKILALTKSAAITFFSERTDRQMLLLFLCIGVVGRLVGTRL